VPCLRDEIIGIIEGLRIVGLRIEGLRIVGLRIVGLRIEGYEHFSNKSHSVAICNAYAIVGLGLAFTGPVRLAEIQMAGMAGDYARDATIRRRRGTRIRLACWFNVGGGDEGSCGLEMR
jgi:hypothetical protein